MRHKLQRIWEGPDQAARRTAGFTLIELAVVLLTCALLGCLIAPALAGAGDGGKRADGRFITYRSFASDLVPGDTNGVPDVFFYDRLAGSTSLLSLSAWGDYPANNRSGYPVFSGDSQTVVFQSWASDLASQDFNPP